MKPVEYFNLFYFMVLKFIVSLVCLVIFNFFNFVSFFSFFQKHVSEFQTDEFLTLPYLQISQKRPTNFRHSQTSNKFVSHFDLFVFPRTRAHRNTAPLIATLRWKKTPSLKEAKSPFSLLPQSQKSKQKLILFSTLLVCSLQPFRVPKDVNLLSEQSTGGLSSGFRS